MHAHVHTQMLERHLIHRDSRNFQCTKHKMAKTRDSNNEEVGFPAALPRAVIAQSPRVSHAATRSPVKGTYAEPRDQSNRERTEDGWYPSDDWGVDEWNQDSKPPWNVDAE